MNSLLIRKRRWPKEEYNNIPVHFCKECLSLRVMSVAGMDEASYCDDCGSTDIGETSIKEWDELYEKKHGFKYLENKY